MPQLKHSSAVLAAAALLGCSLLLDGCARRVVVVDYRTTTLEAMRVSGRITVTGDPPGGVIEVAAAPIARDGDAGVGRIERLLRVEQPSGGSMERTVAYEFEELPTRVLREEVRTERWLGLLPRSRGGSSTTHLVEGYVVSVMPPRGWTATPKEYVLSQGSDGADFLVVEDDRDARRE